MTLTLGSAPLGRSAAGKFNFDSASHVPFLYWEPFPKRMRVEFNGKVVADSRAVHAAHESGKMMALYFPSADVEKKWLEASGHRTDSPALGTASYWSLNVDGKRAENVAWCFEPPNEAAAFVHGFFAFDLDKVDAWYQEDERGYAHPRDPYHRFDVHRGSQHVVVRFGSVVVAESNRPILLFETGTPVRYYLPCEDVRRDLLVASSTVSQCPYKGDGQHWNLAVVSADGPDGVGDVAWTLPHPLGEADVVAEHFCFYPGRIEVEVDGRRLAA